MSSLLHSKFDYLTPYTPGEQPKDMQYIKLNTNESPFPPSPLAQQYAKEAAENLQLYSDPECRDLVKTAAEYYGVKEDQLIFTNGSDEILNFVFMGFCEDGVTFPDITYGFYKVFADLNEVECEIPPLNDDFTINIKDYIWTHNSIVIANPNAPTGIALTLSQIEEIVSQNTSYLVVIDEAYVDFGAESAVKLIDKYENLLVVQTFSKSRSLAGARLGVGIGNSAIIKDLNTIRYSTNPYNVNRMTMAAGIGSLKDDNYTKANCQEIIENRKWTEKQLKKLGFSMTDSLANFIFAKHKKADGKQIYLKLKEKGVLVRHFDKERLYDYNRITIGNKEQMKIFIKTLKEVLKELV